MGGGQVAPELLITLTNHLIFAKDFLVSLHFTQGFRKYQRSEIFCLPPKDVSKLPPPFTTRPKIFAPHLT